MKKFFKNAIILTVCATMVFALSACGNNESKNPPKFTLYCGLNDKIAGRQVVSIEEAKELARFFITENGCGYTEYVAYGGYKSGDEYIGNDTLIYEIYFAEEDVVKRIAAEIQSELNLNPILISEGTTEYQFTE